MSGVSFTGIVTNLSHVFYLPGNSKCFFLEVFAPDLEDELLKNVDRLTIVARLKGLHESFRMFHKPLFEPPIGKRFEFSSLSHGSLKIQSQAERIRVFQTNPNSRVQPIEVSGEEQIECPNASKEKLISYEGIVTDDSKSHSAIYTLDQKVVLVLTGLAIVSNVRIFRRGQRVQIINGHLEKIYSKPVLFICGRGFVWSRRDPDADADKLNSIHSKLSNSIFQASPLVLAALHFNLNIAQILDFNFELDNFRKKFCEENLNAVLSEKFTKVSNVIKFAQLLNLENLASNDSLRSLVNEYLSKPHVCNISVSGKRKRCVKEDSGPMLTIAALKEILLSHHDIQLQEKRERYSNLRSMIQFDFCQKSSKEIFTKNELLIGKIVLNQKTGRFELQDVTGSIPVCLAAQDLRSFEASYLGDIVRICSFKSCLEVSKSGAKTLKTLYVTCRTEDVQTFNLARALSSGEKTVASGNNFRKIWKVLYASGPVFVGNYESAFFCSVRQLTVGAGNAFDSTLTQIKFLRLPFKSTSQILPGSVIKTETKEAIPERFSDQLQNHFKKFYQSNMYSNKVDILTKNDDVSIDCNELSSTLQFSLSEFDEIPENELVTIEGTISERWLERQQYCATQTYEDLEGFDSIFRSHSLQLKLKDPRLTSKNSSTISVYVTNWYGHPYPLGLLPDHEIRISNVIKMISKKGHSYFTASLFTTFQLIDNCMMETKEEQVASLVKSGSLLSSSEANCNEKTDFIINLVKMFEANNPKENLKFGTFTCTVTLELLLKVSISALCSSCENQLHAGRCDFVGCHIGTKLTPKFVTRCSALIEDETAAAILHVQDAKMVQDLLQLSDCEWEHIMDATLQSGELLYLANNKTEIESAFKTGSDLDRAKLLFHTYCQKLPQSIYCKFVVRCRPFKASNLDFCTRDDASQLKLFCLDIYKI